jgi:hypothetical protein
MGISVGRVLRGTENMCLICLNKNDNKIRALKTFECKIYYSQWSEASDADNIKSFDKKVNKSKEVPLLAMEALGGRGGISPH